jgi:PHD/YefM family antitoxin component YafN of YafNO toxin-antitoxin module
MYVLSANELKKKGISVVEPRLAEGDEVVVTIRGQERYVIMDIEKYAKLREYELAAAVEEARADYEAGRFTVESVEEHVKRLRDDV